jgi:hypothetical protein
VALDTKGLYLNDSAIIFPSTDPWLLAVLNSPVIWYIAFRTFPHKKDEALAMDIPYVQDLPIPAYRDECREVVEKNVRRLCNQTEQSRASLHAVLDWLHVEYAIEKASQKLQDVSALDAEALVAEVKKIRGKKQPLTVAGLKALKEEHARSVVPLQQQAIEARTLERQVSDMVNAAYGLTEEETSLMWRTAPPRMPLSPPRGNSSANH